MHLEFNVVFKSVGCFKGTFSIEAKDAVKSYHASPKCVAYTTVLQ